MFERRNYRSAVLPVVCSVNCIKYAEPTQRDVPEEKVNTDVFMGLLPEIFKLIFGKAIADQVGQKPGNSGNALP